VNEATMLLHVVDAGKDPERQIEAVEGVLREIGVRDKPTVLALNKIDLLSDEQAGELRIRFPTAVLCSAREGIAVDDLLGRCSAELSRLRVEVELHIPFDRGEMVARVHDEGEVLKEDYSESGTHIVARIRREAIDDFGPFLAPTGE
jgi:GTPase